MTEALFQKGGKSVDISINGDRQLAVHWGKTKLDLLFLTIYKNSRQFKKLNIKTENIRRTYDSFLTLG